MHMENEDSKESSFLSFFDSSDLCAQGGELFDDALVAALHIVDVLDIGGALGGETRDDEGGTCPQILSRILYTASGRLDIPSV
jgi:hypothetical protein